MERIALKDRRAEVGSIFRLAWPAIVQEMLGVVVNYADTAMVGALGANASAAVGLTSTVNWLLMSVCGAIGVGVLSVCAQADGSGDRDTVSRAGQQALFLAGGLGILLTALTLGCSPFLAVWLGGAEEIRAEATRYFTIISIPILFRAFQTVFSSALRGVSDMKTPMLIGLGMNIVNIILNFFLIYETRTVELNLFGQTLTMAIPGAGMGVTGAAIASAIAFTLGGLMMFLRYYRSPRFRLYETGFHFDKAVTRRCLTIGLPAAANRVVICMGHVAFSSLIARLGVIELAAHSIAIQAEQAFYMSGYGFQAAAATMAGNAVGERDEKKLVRVTGETAAIACSVMTVAGVLLYLTAPGLMGLFTADREVISLGAAVLRLISVTEPIYALLIILEGIFDGIGDTRAPVLYAIITMWGIRVLGTALVTRVFSLGLVAVWCTMAVDNICRAGLLGQRFLRKKWRHVFRPPEGNKNL